MNEGTTPSNPVQIWIKALTQPRTETYSQIVRDPGASIGKAVLWLAGAGLLGGLFTGIVRGVFNVRMLDRFSQFSDFGDIGFLGAASGFMAVIWGVLGGVVGSLIGAFILTGIVQLAARALGGTGSFEQLFYGYAAFQAPLGLVTAVLGVIPVINCLSIPLGIYGLVLMVIANQAVHEYDTGKAIISSLAPVLILLVICVCIFAGIFAFLTPVIENISGGF